MHDNFSRLRLVQALLVLVSINRYVLGRGTGSLELQGVAESGNLFAEDVYRILTQPSTHEFNSSFENKNVLISPLSIDIGLAMLMAGTVGNTREEMIKGLRLRGDMEETERNKGFRDLIVSLRETSDDEEGVKLQLANRIYVGQYYPIKPSFLHTIRQHYFADAEQLNFGEKEIAAETVNKWIRDATRDKIKQIVTPTMLNNQTLVILVNAIHFKGEWKYPFNPDLTSKSKFTTLAGYDAPVDMMSLEKPRQFKHARLPDLGASAVALPYVSQRYSFIILLPEKGQNLKDVEVRIQDGTLASIPSRMRSTWVDVRMPKFKLESNVDLIGSKIVENLGMTSITSQLAEFDEMSDEKGVHITNAIHKGVLDINEAGSEAAAATALVAQARSLELESHRAIKFVVDRPFIAYIFDSKTESILFVARKVM